MTAKKLTTEAEKRMAILKQSGAQLRYQLHAAMLDSDLQFWVDRTGETFITLRPRDQSELQIFAPTQISNVT